MSLTEANIIGISPFRRPDPRLVIALARAGATAVLDPGADPAAAAVAVAAIARHARDGDSFGVITRPEAQLDPESLPACFATALLPAGAPTTEIGRWRLRRVLAQVTSAAEARAAAEAGADGLVLKGNEAAGPVGETSSFVLVQQVAAADLGLPYWVRGGVGPHTAAACVAAGAAGVVLDDQLALVRESTLPESLRAQLRSLDGSETVVRDGVRVLQRPGNLQPEDAESPLPLGADDLSRQLLPVGQDGASAAPLAEAHATAGGVVQAIVGAVAEHLRQAAEADALRPGGPLSAAHGTRFPVVQGPMTRVSDEPAFAEAVARGGGLPFIALALLRGPQIRAILSVVAEQLGDLPWGVGILGFVPHELRTEQLAVISEFKPPFALIAGGRPSQAKELEDAGTPTYLHVPSPRLLDQFFKRGARRFVFEGRECGGHVGPRNSFPLWESQIDRLLAHGDLGEVAVLFAGGIHDARSAAMVAAMAAPLSARGAKVGVLIGTAYLFTDEAVSTGAIKPAYREMAISSDATVLLETAPGHATRCVDSAYVQAFQAERARLEAEGLEQRVVWERLESLNLGRLRIASKGIRREGAELVEVDEPGQLAEGMYMIGQVAALRGEPTTIEALHRDLSEGAGPLLRALAPPAPSCEDPAEPADVAIIGMACVYPDSPDVDSFWANVLRGHDAIREVPPERWNAGIYFDPDAPAGQRSYSKWGGFLPPIPFDPMTYGIPPKSLAAIEPVQLLALEVARRAIADAGYAERPFARHRTAVIFGAEASAELAGAYGFRALYPQYVGELPPELDRVLPSLTEDSFPGVLANVISGRIANRLDLGGCNFSVDAACASSLAAVDLAIKELVTGHADMALAGGADLHNSANDFLLFSSVYALSHGPSCKPFDATADGTLLGEGVAVLVLKRLADAERDGDRIYAVIKGVAGASDGKSLGLTAPRKEGQERALRRAYCRAGVSPREVGLLEAHGTGTVVGDRTELDSMTSVFAQAGVEPRTCTLGSVKSQIGHTKCAAGMAALIKVSLSIYHRVLPPTLHVENPNPGYEGESSPFVFAGNARPWGGSAASRRHGGVSAFGFGGTNFHTVLAPYDRFDVRLDEKGAAGLGSGGSRVWPGELFLFRGADRDAALRTMGLLGERLSDERPWELRDLARSASERTGGPVQLALVATDRDDLAEKLKLARKLEPDPRGIFVAEPDAAGGPVAWLFPGQGSQYPGMLAELFCHFPELHDLLDLGEPWVDRIYPADVYTDEGRAAQRAALTDTRVAQPALGLCDLAVARLLRRLGIEPSHLAGHSYGELVALCAAGALSEADLLPLSRARGEAMLGAAGDDPGKMAAVKAGADRIAPVLAELPEVVLANHNSPKQTIISGPTPAVDAAMDLLKAAKLRARPIEVACAFHSSVVAGAEPAFARALADVPFTTPARTVWSNTTAAAYPAEPDAIRARLAEHLVKPVLFTREIEAMYEAGARVFLEVGPGRVLTGLVGQILAGRPHVAVAVDAGASPLLGLLRALGQLAVAGVDFDHGALWAGRGARRFDLERPPSRAHSATTWMVNGHRAWPVHGEPPASALIPVRTPPVELVPRGSAEAAASAGGGTREETVLEYLRNTRELVEVQRQVMLSYLGTPPGAVPAAPSAGLVIDAIAHEAEAAPATEAQPETAAPVAARPISDLLLEIVSERTGYPAEMLDLDLDLEGELSIDSIKRIEILGALAESEHLAGVGEVGEEAIEELAALRTLREVIVWLEASGEGDAGSDSAAKSEEIEAAPEPDEGAPPGTQRYVLVPEAAPAEAGDPELLKGRTFALTDDEAGVAKALAELLEKAGAKVRLLASGEAAGEVDGLVFTRALDAGTGSGAALELFGLAREVLGGGAGWLVAATGPSGRFGDAPEGDDGGGIAGLLKAAARELPEVVIRSVELAKPGAAKRAARHLLDELLIEGGPVEVARRGGERLALISETPVSESGAAASAAHLDGDSVVLITGGARGITARFALELARRFGCTLELVGRSPVPEGEPDAELAAAEDEGALKRLLIARNPGAALPEIEKIFRKTRAEHEIRANLAAIADAGGRATYHAVDVRDEEAFGALIDRIYADHGRLDGVVHGAGVIEDKLLADKEPESFARVFDTKVRGALTLAARLKKKAPPAFVVFFSSVSSAYGNRGQTDYAAANDVLDRLAHVLGARLNGTRALSVNWGPWDSAGMVSPELRREYARRGIGLIGLDEGAELLAEEIFGAGASGARQLVVMNAAPRAMA